MIYLDALWGLERKISISGTLIRVPFGVDLQPELVLFISKWRKASGDAWTVQRVKALKIWALHVLGREREYSSPWFKSCLYRGYRIPRLELFKHLVDNLFNLKQVRLVLTVLNSYKQILVGEPQLDSVIGTPVSKPSTDYVRLLRQLVELPRVPSSVLEPVSSIATNKKYCTDSGATHDGPYGLYDSTFPAELALVFNDMNEGPACLGRLIPIPDKGKWRTILVGHGVIQCRTRKLADWLRSWLWSQPEIASGDQGKMSRFVVDAQLKGKTLLSIDLSNATDRLSRELQIQLLVSMGVPLRYFDFLRLPFYYIPKQFGMEGTKLRQARYSNGQPMGLMVSFPMFELAHYVILRWVVAPYRASFTICGDDVVIACDQGDAPVIFDRYKNLIERFGGEISLGKTLVSDHLAEGVGAIFLKGHPEEIRIPSGKLCNLELGLKGSWVHREISKGTMIGRAILFPFLSRKEYRSYTYDHRKYLNEVLITKDLSDFHPDGLRDLAYHDDYPQRWPVWEDSPTSSPMRSLEEELHFRWVSEVKFMDALVSNKLINLYKKEDRCQKPKNPLVR